jgi:thymidylate synthase (FAD)
MSLETNPTSSAETPDRTAIRQSLLGKRIAVLDKGWIELQDLMGDDLAIVNAARASFLGESKGDDKDKKLLFYLMQHRHTSPFEQVEFKFRVRAPVVTWWQWVRHRTWCLAGDTDITFNRPDHWRRGIHTRQTDNKGQTFTIERLYRLWQSPHYRTKIEKMLLRVYDEASNVFTVSSVEDVIYSGKKPVFEVELEGGSTLRCSKDHLLLTSEGWQRLEDAIGLSFHVSGTATISKECTVLTNGYTQPAHTPEHLEKLKATVKRGPDSHFWRGGIAPEQAKIGAWTTVHSGKELGRNHSGTPLAALPQKIVKVTYLGVQDTYDISVAGPHHNFVANGVVVHNSFNAQSGRYVSFEEDDFYTPSVWRKQSPSNKQASLGELTPEEAAPLFEALDEHYRRGYELYQQALAAGVAREMARLFLPGFSIYYTWVCKVDAHNLMHFLELRMAEEAQYEIRVYAQAIYESFFKPALPWTAEAFEKFALQHGR